MSEVNEKFEPSYFARLRAGGLRVYDRSELASAGLGMVMTRMSTAKSVYNNLIPFYKNKRTEYYIVIFQDDMRRTLGVVAGTDLDPGHAEMRLYAWVLDKYESASHIMFIHNHAEYTTSSARRNPKWWVVFDTSTGPELVFPFGQLSPSKGDMRGAEKLRMAGIKGVEGYLVGPDGCSRFYPVSNPDVYVPHLNRRGNQIASKLLHAASRHSFARAMIGYEDEVMESVMNIGDSVDLIIEGMQPQVAAGQLVEEQQLSWFEKQMESTVWFKAFRWVYDKLKGVVKKVNSAATGSKGHREFQSLANRYGSEVKKLAGEAESLVGKAQRTDEKGVPGLKASLGRMQNTVKYLKKTFKAKGDKIKKLLPDAVKGDKYSKVGDALGTIGSTLSDAEKRLAKW